MLPKVYTLITAICLFFTTHLSAQIPDSSICPNFSANDINGNRHTLYNYLDSGYTVYVEIAATWCPPCWQLHTSNVLKKFYNAFGPNGTNQVRLLFIESEPLNTIAQLQGVLTDSTRKGMTYGNWLTNTPYPIIDDATIAPLLGVQGYPTICAISLNRQLFTMEEQTLERLMAQLNNPIMASGKNNISILHYSGTEAIFCSVDPFIPEVKIQNLGLDTVKSYEISLKINNRIVETKKIRDVVLKKYDILLTDFNPINLNDSSYLTFTILKVNNVPDTITYRNSAAYLIAVNSKISDQEIAIVEVRTDKSPEQTYWKIVDQNGIKIAEGGNTFVHPYDRKILFLSRDAYSTPFTIYRHEVGLKLNTCYDIYVWDEHGDGLTQNYNYRGGIIGPLGYFKIIANNKTLYDLGYNDYFGEIKRPLERGSVVNVQSIDNLNDLKLYPSPAHETLTLNFSLSTAKELTISVVNILGQTLKTLPKQFYTEGGNTIAIDVENLTNGVYFVHLKDVNATAVRKCIIQH